MTMSNPLSRRQALQLLGIAGAGLAAACTDTSGSNNPVTHLKKGKFTIPDPGGNYPSGDVKLRWVDSGDTKADFFNAFFPVYEKKHDNVHIDYQGTNWNTIQQIVGTGVRNGTAPDVFQLPAQITVTQAVTNKWIGTFDDIVPNWSQVKAKFPPGTFADGITDFDGKTYGMPLSGSTRIGFETLYNVDIVKKTGFDPTKNVLSWDDLRTLAKKATKNGDGDYYGVIIGMAQEGQLAGTVSTLAEMAGVAGGADAGNSISGGIDWRTGEFNYTKDETIAAIELFLAMRDDKSIFPGSVSLDAPGARGRFPQGAAAIIFQGAWNIPVWERENPDLNLGVALPAQQDPSNIWPLTHGPGGSDTWFYFSRTKAQQVIGDIFSYMSTMNAQTQWANYNGAGDPPKFPEAMKKADLDELERTSYDLAQKYTMLRPEPAVRNPDVSQAYLANVPVSPNFDQTLVGLYTKQIGKSVKAAMKDLQDRSEKGREDAIKKARSRGAKVSESDWVFKDWNPRKPYTKLYES